jgi:capsular polysaccharide biosynthesis protein
LVEQDQGGNAFIQTCQEYKGPKPKIWPLPIDMTRGLVPTDFVLHKYSYTGFNTVLH